MVIGSDAVLWMVDDNPADREIVGIACEIIGYPGSFVAFANGLQVFERLQEIATLPLRWPDVILLDINMPRTSGLSVLRQLRQHPQWNRLPVVIFSTSSNEELVARQEGATDYVVKPSLMADTIAILRRIIEQFCKRRSG